MKRHEVEEYEIEYWCKEFPDLAREDIADLLQALEDDKNGIPYRRGRRQQTP